MIKLLARLFIKNCDDYADPEVRRAYGTLCSFTAIGLNLLLFVGKFLAGRLSGSLSVTADAINNLTDVGSALLILLAFRFAGKKPEPEHPFGHGRIEYVAGLVVAGLILVLAVSLGRDSVESILHPGELTFSWVVVGVLLASIAVKCYMSYFMVSTSKKIDSATLKATGMDALSDTISTFAVLLSLVIYAVTPKHLNLDGWFGLLVSLLILRTGLESAKETLSQLLGTTPDPALVQQVEDICMSYDEIIGIHDLVVHDYGPGRLHISVHCEVPGNGDIYVLHDAMDRAMLELDERLGCTSVIHMDPVCTDDEHIVEMRQQLAEAVKQLGEGVSVHDFRLVEGPTHTNVIFDCLVPLTVEKDEKTAKEKVTNIASSLWANTYAIVQIDRPYV